MQAMNDMNEMRELTDAELEVATGGGLLVLAGLLALTYAAVWLGAATADSLLHPTS
jgi:hypothetical protein